MGFAVLTERYASWIAGTLSCWDRVLLFGTLPRICFAEGMTSYLHARKIRIFDYPRFAEPFRNRLRENAERLAAENGIDIEFLRKRNLRCARRSWRDPAGGSPAQVRGGARLVVSVASAVVTPRAKRTQQSSGVSDRAAKVRYRRGRGR